MPSGPVRRFADLSVGLEFRAAPRGNDARKRSAQADSTEANICLLIDPMTFVRRCLRKVDEAAALADSALAERLLEALTELEAAYARPSERIVALESVLHAFERGPRAGDTTLGRILRIAIDRRQSFWARRSGMHRDTTGGLRFAPSVRGAEPVQASPV